MWCCARLPLSIKILGAAGTRKETCSRSFVPQLFAISRSNLERRGGAKDFFENGRLELGQPAKSAG